MATRCDDIPILEVISTLGLETFKKNSNEYGIYEGSEKTDGWSVAVDLNIVKDFSKDRPQGGPFSVVSSYLNLSDHNTFVWFEENFSSYKPNKISALSVRNSLPELDDKCKEYLKSRGIEYDKVSDCTKGYNGSIACMIYSGGMPSGINARTLNTDHKKRFTAYPGLSTNGIYQGQLDKSKDYVYVVEGLIDFLTVRQYETNVVGLKSAESGIEDIIRLAREYKIIIIFDNDDAGKLTMEKLSSIKYRYFNWNCEESISSMKDFNDLHSMGGELTIDYVKDNLLSDTPIMRTIDKFRERQKIIKERGKLGIDGPYEIYNETSGIVKGKVYTIGAFSNTGKSKFAYAHAGRFIKQGYRVMYVSVEESEEDMFGNILATLYELSINRLGDIKINEKDFENLILSDNAKTIVEIDDLVKLHRPDILFIDYAQGLQAKGGSSYEKQASIALGIQQIAIQNKIIVFSMSQLANEMMKEMKQGISGSDIVSLKGAGEYYSASDVIFVITRSEYDDGNLVLSIQKNKLGRRGSQYDMEVIWSCNKFTLSRREDNYNTL